MSLYFLTKKTKIDNLTTSKGTRTHTRQDTIGSLTNSQQSNRKSSLHNHLRQPLTILNKNPSISLHVDTDEGGSIKRMNCYQSINNKMERFSQTKKNVQNMNFYEGVYLVGSQNNKSGIIYKFGQSPIEHLLPDMLFPYGANDVQRKLSDSMSELNSILYKRHVSEDNPDCFVIPIKTPQSFEKKLALIHENQNQLAFCICLKIKDIQHNKSGYMIYERILCIVSYLPLFKYFTDFLISVVNCAKEERLKSIPFAQYIKNCNLFETLPMQVPSQQISPKYYEYNSIQTKELGFLKNAIITASITINIIMEQSIIFLGTNVTQLSATLMLFLRHMIWMHQLVACIPPNNVDILNVPVPLLGGMIKEDEEHIEELKLEYPNVVFVDLLHCKIHNCQDFSKSFLFIQLIKQLHGKYQEQIGPIIRNYQRDAIQIGRDDPLLKEFKQTQYYNELTQKGSTEKQIFKR